MIYHRYCTSLTDPNPMEHSFPLPVRIYVSPKRRQDHLPFIRSSSFTRSMEYTPRYAQPFTMEQIMLLDVPIITEGRDWYVLVLALSREPLILSDHPAEIARLQNSVKHLNETQEQLRDATQHTPDPEFIQALEENTIVMWVYNTKRWNVRLDADAS